MNNKELFETTPIPKALATMAVPTIISQLITTVYNMADTLFIGMSNDPYKVAAATLSGVLFFFMNALANLFGIGGGSLLSRLLGQKREEEARRVGAFSIYGALAISAIYALICFVFSEKLVIMLGASPNTLEYAQSYLFWVVVIGGIPSTVGMTMSHVVRSAGYAKESSTGLALGGVCNIILDPLFMFVLLPAGNEVTGAAIATTLSNIISLIYFITVFHKHSSTTVLSLSIKEAHPETSSIKQVFSVGLPSCVSSLLANTTSIIRNNLTTGYGDIEMAAYGIVQKIDMLPLNIGMGLCQGMMPLVAYNYASKDYKRMKGFTKAAQMAGVTAALIFIAACQLFAPQIMHLFIQEEQTVRYGSDFLRIACIATPFIISNFQKIYCLQAMGKGKESLMLSICRQGLLAIPILLILNKYAGLYGVVSAQPLSDGITFIFSSLLYHKVYTDLVKKMEQEVTL
ncbi:MAG: MATE family efflux transporter [Erysipelotrichales bacterium]|nr:MATE family efflux transporter [Erysipelotrichales bacterium]